MDEIAASLVRGLVIGDVMLDRYFFGTVSRFAPEAPAPVLSVKREAARAGGAANVATNLAALGSDVTLMGVTGVDAAAEALSELLSTARVRAELLRLADWSTTTKARLMAGDQLLARYDIESDCVPSICADALTASAVASVNNADAVVLVDYDKGVLSAALCQKVIRAARERSVPVVVASKRRDLTRFSGATTLVLNREEAVNATGLPVDTVAQALAAGRRLCESLDLDSAIVTRASEGIVFFSREAEGYVPAVLVEARDTTGAGDTVAATLALGHAAKRPLRDQCELACRAAAVQVACVGTTAVGWFAINDLERPSSSGKLVAPVAIQSWAASRRARGQTIVFTNGCFDLLHRGHVAYLEEARASGDALIVGVNSDASVRRLKGDSRPFNTLEDRQAVLAALSCVDAVTSFDADTPSALIEQIAPDVLVKGGDYLTSAIVGADFVRANGGAVAALALLAGYSTTSLVAKIKAGGGDK